MSKYIKSLTHSDMIYALTVTGSARHSALLLHDWATTCKMIELEDFAWRLRSIICDANQLYDAASSGDFEELENEFTRRAEREHTEFTRQLDEYKKSQESA